MNQDPETPPTFRELTAEEKKNFDETGDFSTPIEDTGLSIGPTARIIAMAQKMRDALGLPRTEPLDKVIDVAGQRLYEQCQRAEIAWRALKEIAVAAEVDSKVLHAPTATRLIVEELASLRQICGLLGADLKDHARVAAEMETSCTGLTPLDTVITHARADFPTGLIPPDAMKDTGHGAAMTQAHHDAERADRGDYSTCPHCGVRHSKTHAAPFCDLRCFNCHRASGKVPCGPDCKGECRD